MRAAQPELPPQAVALSVEPEQPVLFDSFDMGSELLRIEEDAAAGKHTGTTLERRAALREEICERLAQGVSQRRVCRIYGVGANTVRRLVERLERAGKMDAVNKRLAAKFGRVAELSADLLTEHLEAGTLPANVLPISMGVGYDKKRDLESSANEGESVPEKDLNVAALNDWVDRLPKALDCQSSETPSKSA